MNIRGAALVPVLAFCILAGCGVPAESEPRIIPSIAIARSTSAPPTVGSSPGASTELLYFVREGRLVRVARTTLSVLPVDVQLEHLLAGPTEAERDTELTSVLTGTQITERVQLQAGEATVDIGNRSDGNGRSDEVLAYGQIVCTLSARPDVDTVSFRYDGHGLRVPRADGSLSAGALTCADYADLVASG